jgi:hypothetical protein
MAEDERANRKAIFEALKIIDMNSKEVWFGLLE